MNIPKSLRTTGAVKIARRYFVVNSFDGILTSLGIIIGLKVGGISDQGVVIAAVLGAAVALAVSGFPSGYLVEDAEHRRQIHKLEKAMLKDLSKTKMGSDAREAPFLVALVNGLSPSLAAIIILIPAFLAEGGFLNRALVFEYMMIVAFTLLAFLGAFLGTIAKENIPKYIFKTLLIGVVAATLSSAVSLMG